MRAADIAVDVVAHDGDVGEGETHRIRRALEERGAGFAYDCRRPAGGVLQRGHERPGVERQAVRGLPVAVLLQGDESRAGLQLAEGAVQPVERPRGAEVSDHDRLGRSLIHGEVGKLRRSGVGDMEGNAADAVRGQPDRGGPGCGDDVGGAGVDAELGEPLDERAARTARGVCREPQGETGPPDGIYGLAGARNQPVRLVDGAVQVQDHAARGNHVSSRPKARTGNDPTPRSFTGTA